MWSIVTKILFISVLFSCHSIKNKTSDNRSEDISFPVQNDSIKDSEANLSLPILKFPFQIICGLDPSDKPHFHDVFMVSGFIPTNYLSIKNKTYVLGYYQTEIRHPYLFSFDQNRVKIDSIALHNGNCGNDPWISEICWTQINSLTDIVMIDTAKFYTYNEETYEQTLDSLIIRKDKIHTEPTGKFTLINLAIEKNNRDF